MSATTPVAPRGPWLTLPDLVGTIRRHRRSLVAVPLVVAVAASTALLLMHGWYTATVSLLPESRGAAAGQLAGLAALAGLNLPTGAGGTLSQTPQFYASLLTSRPILRTVLQRRFATNGLRGGIGARDSATLVEILDPPGRTEALRLWNGAKRLAGYIAVRTDLRTGVITLSVVSASPELAAAVAVAFAEELDEFNRSVRQSQARARRHFIEGRLVQVEHELRSTEDALRTFLNRNREYENAPTLRFEYGRLDRAVLVQRELYLQLRRELDAARIAEVDDIPVLTVIEPALVPQRRSGPSRRKWLVAVVVATLMIQSAVLLVYDHHHRLFPGFASQLPLRRFDKTGTDGR